MKNNSNTGQLIAYDVVKRDSMRLTNGGMSLEKKLSSDLYNTAHKILPRKYFTSTGVTNTGSDVLISETSSPMDYVLDGVSSPMVHGSSVASISGHTEQGTNLDRAKSMQKLVSFVFKPKVAPIQRTISQMPFFKSIAYAKRLNWMSDLGIYFSNRFKFSFGMQNTLILPTTYNNVDREMKGM